MATSSTNAAAALGDLTRFAEMRKRLFFLLGALVVYRVGTFIPVPGIDAARFATFFNSQNGTLLGMFNMFSGGALQRFSIFALNVMPYITASIIIQMASMVYPPWAQIRKDGESGRRKLMQYTRYGTVLLAAFPGFRRSVRDSEFRQRPGAQSGSAVFVHRHGVDHDRHACS